MVFGYTEQTLKPRFFNPSCKYGSQLYTDFGKNNGMVNLLEGMLSKLMSSQNRPKINPCDLRVC
jgi:hypothetical protein